VRLSIEIVTLQFSVWLVSCYAHVFVRPLVVIVTDRLFGGWPPVSKG